MSITIPTPADHMGLYLAAGALLLVLLSARRVPVLGRIASLVMWVGLLGTLMVVASERAAFDPILSRLTGALRLDRQEVVGRETRVRISPDGHFWVRATIDGVSRRLLVDSGATVTTLSTDVARAAGLDMRRHPFPIMLHTANGTVAASTATVRTLKLGNIVARDLPVVIAPGMEGMNVVGMNLLSRLKGWRVADGELVLTPHHPQAGTSATTAS